MIELCKIGMTQATAALGRLIGKEVSMEEPRLRHLDEAQSAHPFEMEQATAIRLGISGDWGGAMLILLGDEEARRILELLLGEEAQDQPFSELQASALMEVGNIMASACLNAMGAVLKTALLPSVPTLLSGEPAQLLKQAAQDQGDAAVAVEAAFSVASPLCRGSFLLIPAQIPAQGGSAQPR